MRKLTLLFVLLLASCHSKKAPPPPPSYPVTLTEATTKPMDIFIEALGHVESITSISIRSRIEGELTGIYFKQGQEVKKGDLLFTIDPKPYEAALKETKGTLDQTFANLALAKEKVTRYRTLAGAEYYSQIDYETLQSNYAALLAQVEQNQGAVDSAAINLDYCWIYAPIDGKTGILQVDYGNLVSVNETILITLNQMAPIFVTFSVPEFQLQKIRCYQKKNEQYSERLKNREVDKEAPQIFWPERGAVFENTTRSEDKKYEAKPTQSKTDFSVTKSIKIAAAFEDFEKETFQGKLYMIDNEVDPETGMIKIRALFENEERDLWPGQFIRTRLILTTIPDATVIPYSALQLTTSGPIAFVVGKNMTVSQRKVKLGQREGDEVMVLEGIAPGEKVVLDGQINLSEGAKVFIAGKK